MSCMRPFFERADAPHRGSVDRSEGLAIRRQCVGLRHPDRVVDQQTHLPHRIRRKQNERIVRGADIAETARRCRSSDALALRLL